MRLYRRVQVGASAVSVYWPPIANTVEFARKIDFINAAAISIPVLWSTYFSLSKQPL